MRKELWPLTIVLSAALMACGGGGGSSDSDVGGEAPGAGGGDGTPGPSVPEPAAPVPVRLAAGTGYSLAVRADGTVVTWGTQMSGGPGPSVPGTSAHVVEGVANAVAVVAMRVAPPFNRSMALRQDGSLLSWGRDAGPAPAAAPAGGAYGQVVACFDGADYGLRADGTVWRLRAGGATQLAGLERVARIGEAHTSNTCGITAIDAAGDLRIVDGDTAGQAVAGLPALEQAVCNFSAAALNRYCLAVAVGGKVWAWGANDAGQLGDGALVGRTLPVELPLTARVTTVAASVGTSFALAEDGVVYSWGGGLGNLDRLGREVSMDTMVVPTPVERLPRIAELAAGPHMLARAADGSVWSWGSNLWGEGGTGTAGDNAFFARMVQGLNLDQAP